MIESDSPVTSHIKRHASTNNFSFDLLNTKQFKEPQTANLRAPTLLSKLAGRASLNNVLDFSLRDKSLDQQSM